VVIRGFSDVSHIVKELVDCETIERDRVSLELHRGRNLNCTKTYQPRTPSDTDVCCSLKVLDLILEEGTPKISYYYAHNTKMTVIGRYVVF